MQVRRHWIFWTLQILVVFLRRPADVSPGNQLDGKSSVAKFARQEARVKTFKEHQFPWVFETCNGFVLPVCVLLKLAVVNGNNFLLAYFIWSTERFRWWRRRWTRKWKRRQSIEMMIVKSAHCNWYWIPFLQLCFGNIVTCVCWATMTSLLLMQVFSNIRPSLENQMLTCPGAQKMPPS